ncbi:uncharacterized protein K452DRAFT_347514, partial [Aplosporella prunicola CBS 121167]
MMESQQRQSGDQYPEGGERPSWDPSSGRVSPIEFSGPSHDAYQPVREGLDTPPIYPVKEQEQPPTSVVPQQRTVSDLWLWEIVSNFISIACIVVIAVILSVFDGKALSQWQPPIKPNALISIFATIAKATLLLPVAECISQIKWLYYGKEYRSLVDVQCFDQASRGPWGSLMFLWRFRARSLVASFGCLITIVSLAVDPFTQQIISYPERSVSLGNTSASVNAARVYDTGLTASQHNMFSQYMDVGMQAAILSGLYGESSTVSHYCPTGNCTWPDITSLSVCNSCSNVTTSTNRTCNSSGQANVCQFTTPAGHEMQAKSGVKGAGVYNTLINASTVNLARGSTADILSFGAIILEESQEAFEVPLAEAYDCSFRWCVRTYSGFNISSGVINSGTHTSNDLEYVEDIGDVAQPNEADDGVYEVFQIPDNVSWTGNRTYVINFKDEQTTGAFMATLFDVGLYSQRAYTESLEGVRIDYTLFKSSNFTRTIDNIANSMTTRVRNGKNATGASGEAWKNETFIKVSWAWFI